jgi:DNA invertase Pin-like site-specific DNA recombinase
MFCLSDDAQNSGNGRTLASDIAARIRDCISKIKQGMVDQPDLQKVESDPRKIKHVTVPTKGQSERYRRPELARIEEEISKGGIDCIISENLSRFARDTEAV